MQAGAYALAAMLAPAGVVYHFHSSRREAALPVATEVRPWLLIVIGILILTDTGFDAI